MDIKLKPCPFCGGDAGLRYAESKGFSWAKIRYPYVKCNICGASVRLEDSEQRAIDAWNRRADDEQIDD